MLFSKAVVPVRRKRKNSDKANKKSLQTVDRLNRLNTRNYLDGSGFGSDRRSESEKSTQDHAIKHKPVSPNTNGHIIADTGVNHDIGRNNDVMTVTAVPTERANATVLGSGDQPQKLAPVPTFLPSFSAAPPQQPLWQQGMDIATHFARSITTTNNNCATVNAMYSAPLSESDGPHRESCRNELSTEDIREFMRENRISQMAVAREIGVSSSSISRIFKGNHFFPRARSKLFEWARRKMATVAPISLSRRPEVSLAVVPPRPHSAEPRSPRFALPLANGKYSSILI